MTGYVDSHCHLDLPELLGDLDGVLARMREARVTHALCISINLERYAQVLALAEREPNLYASVGVHPDQQDAAPVSADQLVALAEHPRVVAIGETGLDYHWCKGDTGWQRQRFREHIRAARRCGKPLVVHMREADADTIEILREERASEVRGVMHCFTGTLEVARAAMALGFLISFSGIVTFRNARALKEVARAVPLERLLIETDAPYLAPEPHRGRRNEPAFVAHVAAEIARLKGIEVETVARATRDNFFSLFRVEP
jgi:TatD DNase family protein